VAWLGSNPFNAQQIQYEDRYEYVPAGYASVSGTGWTVNSGNARWNFTKVNDWDYDHFYSGINATGLITHVRRVPNRESCRIGYRQSLRGLLNLKDSRPQTTEPSA
jgi:hypothetical protein